MAFRSKVDAAGNGGRSSAGSRLFLIPGSNEWSSPTFGFSRKALGCSFSLLFVFFSLPGLGQHSHPSPPAPHAAPAPHLSAPHAPSGSTRPNPQQPRPSGEQHLSEWLKQNQGLSPQEQMNRLQREPGFNRLPPDQQQRLVQRLQQVDRMPPDQRQRRLEQVEMMEHLSPQQQQTVRWSASRLGQLPPNRQQAVKETIRALRGMPPAQRQSELLSPRYASQLTPEERYIAGSLLMVEPYRPQQSAPH
jgi:hypothetical protein